MRKEYDEWLKRPQAGMSWSIRDIKNLYPEWSIKECEQFLNIYAEDLYDEMLSAAMTFIKDKAKWMKK